LTPIDENTLETPLKHGFAETPYLQNLVIFTQAIDEEVEQLLASGSSLPECVRLARLEEEEQKEVDRLQRIREDIIGLEQALEESSSKSEGNELGVLGEDDEREEFVFDF